MKINILKVFGISLKKYGIKDYYLKDLKIVPYCSRCGTVLSSHEVSQGYQNIEENSVYLNFKVLMEIIKSKKMILFLLGQLRHGPYLGMLHWQ